MEHLNEYFAYKDFYFAWGWFKTNGNLLIPSEKNRVDDISHTHSTILTGNPKARDYYDLKPEYYKKGYSRWMIEYSTPKLFMWTFSPLYVTRTHFIKGMSEYEDAIISGKIEKVFRPKIKANFPEYISLGFVKMKPARPNDKRKFHREHKDLPLIKWGDSRMIWTLIQARLEKHYSGEDPLE